MTATTSAQTVTADKCRHDVSEDCPACMADEIARLTSSLAAADARGKRLEEAVQESLKIVGEPASGNRMISSRREAFAVYKILVGVLSQTEEGRPGYNLATGERDNEETDPAYFEKVAP